MLIILRYCVIPHSILKALNVGNSIFKDPNDEFMGYTVGAHDIDKLSVQKGGLILGNLRVHIRQQRYIDKEKNERRMYLL